MMNNPTRRNRNIGTAKQGHGQNNSLRIPWPSAVCKSFYERLGEYRKETHVVHGVERQCVVEKTLHDFMHACSVADVIQMLQLVPAEDIDGVELIVFRQPKRKETILSPVWGRMIYYYEFENRFGPAVVLEAVYSTGRQRWPKKLCVESQMELERLRRDGHAFVTDRRHHVAPFEKAAVRNTQLYRTLLHEIGHYVHYLREVVQPNRENDTDEKRELRSDRYFDGIPQQEKENFAHTYAERIYAELAAQNLVPFEQRSNT